MGKEEAIDLLDNLIGMVEDNHDSDYDTALKMAIKALEQEPAYCDRNICLKNEYNNIGCDECEVTKSQEPNTVIATGDGAYYRIKALSQEPKTGHWIAIDEEPHEDYECDKCGYTVSTYTANIEPHTEYKFCPSCGCRMVEPQESEE